MELSPNLARNTRRLMSLGLPKLCGTGSGTPNGSTATASNFRVDPRRPPEKHSTSNMEVAVQTVLDKYCTEFHSGPNPKANLNQETRV